MTTRMLAALTAAAALFGVAPAFAGSPVINYPDQPQAQIIIQVTPGVTIVEEDDDVDEREVYSVGTRKCEFSRDLGWYRVNRRGKIVACKNNGHFVTRQNNVYVAPEVERQVIVVPAPRPEPTFTIQSLWSF